MECFAPRPGWLVSFGVVLGLGDDGDALGCNSLVVGEKTDCTSSLGAVQPGGGSCFAAAQAVTTKRNINKTIHNTTSSLSKPTRSQRLPTCHNRHPTLPKTNPPRRLIHQLRRLIPSMLAILAMHRFESQPLCNEFRILARPCPGLDHINAVD